MFNSVVKSNQYAGTLGIQRNSFAEVKINFPGFYGVKLCNDISWLQCLRILCLEDGIIKLVGNVGVYPPDYTADNSVVFGLYRVEYTDTTMFRMK